MNATMQDLNSKINEQLWRMEGQKEMANFIFNEICAPDYTTKNMIKSREQSIYVVQEFIVKKFEEKDSIGWVYWQNVKEELYKI
jgi:hypothetical protein